MRRYTTYSGKRWENKTEEAYIMAETMKVYTIEELETLLNVTRRTLYTYIKEGKLQAIKMGKYWRVREDQLDAFLSSDTGKRYMSADTLNPATWTDEDRELIDKLRKLTPEDKDFLLRILTFSDKREDIAEYVSQEASHYRLSTPEGQKNLMEALKALTKDKSAGSRSRRG
jgi:excisionase family DNA binding protein